MFIMCDLKLAFLLFVTASVVMVPKHFFLPEFSLRNIVQLLSTVGDDESWVDIMSFY